MAFNKAATYQQMIGFLKQAGYDVSEVDNVIDEDKTDFVSMSRLDLLHYAAALDAVYEARSDYMNEQAILDEMQEVNERLGRLTLAGDPAGTANAVQATEEATLESDPNALANNVLLNAQKKRDLQKGSQEPDESSGQQ